MPIPTYWFEYGEPTADDRVEAEIRTTYQTGPNAPRRDDDVQDGTVGFEALEMMEENEEIQEHLHQDGSVCLSGLPEEVETEFLKTFEETEAN